MGQCRYLIGGYIALPLVAEMAAHIIDYVGHLSVAQADGAERENRRIPWQAEGRHTLPAVEYGQRHVLPRDQCGIAGQVGIVTGADGALSLRHVAALTNVGIDIRAAGLGGAGERCEAGLIGVGTRCGPRRCQHTASRRIMTRWNRALMP